MRKINKLNVQKKDRKVKVNGGMEHCMTDCAYQGSNSSVTSCPIYSYYSDGPNL